MNGEAARQGQLGVQQPQNQQRDQTRLQQQRPRQQQATRTQVQKTRRPRPRKQAEITTLCKPTRPGASNPQSFAYIANIISLKKIIFHILWIEKAKTKNKKHNIHNYTK